MICKYCGTVNGDEARFCHGCGKALELEPLPLQKRVCPFCGEQVSEEASFCGSCGEKLDAAPAEEQQKETVPQEELRKLKELLDDKIITQEEFDTVKKRLLGLK